MTDRTPTSKAQGADPFRVVADALSPAAEVAREGVADAKAHAADMVAGGGGFLGRLAYNTGYAVSYGVVFPASLVARAISRENAMVYGLTDGAHAARDAVFGRESGRRMPSGWMARTASSPWRR